MGKDVMIACDFSSQDQLLRFLEDHFPEEKPFLKIGMELFYAAGPEVVRQVKKLGHRVFLDLKLHDIPNTVHSAMAVLAGLEVDMVNVHAAGTRAMMEAALDGLRRPDGSRPLLVAVTQLTSTDEARMRTELLIDQPLDQVVMRYAKNAQQSGLDGVVCSPLEVQKVKESCGGSFLTVTPGIRFADSAADDQRRVTTPAMAKSFGSDYIVVGRPITRAKDPLEAYRRCVEEFVG